MSQLLKQQFAFTLNSAKLIQFAYERGYTMSYGDAYRDPRLAELNAVAGIGIRTTLHTKRLAVDLSLFKDGKLLSSSEAYQFLGDFWKSLDPTNCWGGDFRDDKGRPVPDGNHFSSTYGGVK